MRPEERKRTNERSDKAWAKKRMRGRDRESVRMSHRLRDTDLGKAELEGRENDGWREREKRRTERREEREGKRERESVYIIYIYVGAPFRIYLSLMPCNAMKYSTFWLYTAHLSTKCWVLRQYERHAVLKCRIL